MRGVESFDSSNGGEDQDMNSESLTGDGPVAAKATRRGFGRRAAVIGTAIALVSSIAAISGAVVLNRVAPRAVPKVDIVGKGIFNCAQVTGEVGYSPTISSAGSLTKHERVSIWFIATKCKAVKGTKASPVPKYVTGSLSFLDNYGTTCPQLTSAGGPPLGTGVLNLAYNFPQVPVTMIDPSVAPAESVTQAGALWNITGSGGVSDGSYLSPGFKAQIKPNPIAPQSCPRGLTSEYIIRGTLTAV